MPQIDQLKAHLKLHFNYTSFQPGQKEIIQDIMKGNNVLGILPTGSGKSLCYQLPAKLLPGTTIVVSPLISLMIDQVKYLQSIHYKNVVALNSFMEYKERKQVYERLSMYTLIYISTELLQQKEVQLYLQQINISLFVIDEAHCISQWGHEFRPDYLRLHTIIQKLGSPPVLDLSATATAEVQKDIIKFLEIPQMIKHIFPVDRENIGFCIKEVNNHQEKLLIITKVVSEYHVPTLIYCSSRKSTEFIASHLLKNIPNKRIAFYHGELAQMDRVMIQQQFMNDQLDVICCTSAFGMGINKDNIRLIIHYHFPSQIESYIQEVGRAGRDGNSSIGILLYAKNDQYLHKSLIQQELPTKEDLSFIFKQLYQLAHQHLRIPMNIHDVMRLFQVSEIQWRYIYFQLEKNGIICNERIIYNRESFLQAFQSINNHRRQRLSIKQSKLLEIIEWIKSEECFRKNLYRSFQHSYSSTNQCCNNCGFSLDKWTPVYSQQKNNHGQSWENKLKSLLIGVNDESK